MLRESNSREDNEPYSKTLRHAMITSAKEILPRGEQIEHAMV
jgi:hypothetical protein